MKLSKAEEEAKRKLTNWGVLAEKHWREHRPNMVRDLERKGVLYQRLYRAQENAKRLCVQHTENLKLQGVPGGQAAFLAQQLALREYILLPSEEDVPKLGERREK